VHLAVSILGSGRLYEAVREIGGAYDVSARVGSADEIIISTGEDPTPLNTLQTLREAVSWLCAEGAATQGEGFTVQDLEEAKLSLFSEIDSPVAPESKGLSAFIYGVSIEARQQYRDWMFNTTREQVRAAARRWIQEPLAEGRYAVAISGDAPKLKKQLAKAGKAAGVVTAVSKDKDAAKVPVKPQTLLKTKPKVVKAKVAPVAAEPSAVPLSTVKADVLPSAWTQMEVLVRVPGQAGPKMQ
jgi:Zn-dependent M16 (insulinase) family peptidase